MDMNQVGAEPAQQLSKLMSSLQIVESGACRESSRQLVPARRHAAAASECRYAMAPRAQQFCFPLEDDIFPSALAVVVMGEYKAEFFRHQFGYRLGDDATASRDNIHPRVFCTISWPGPRPSDPGGAPPAAPAACGEGRE